MFMGPSHSNNNVNQATFEKLSYNEIRKNEFPNWRNPIKERFCRLTKIKTSFQAKFFNKEPSSK